MKSYSTVIKNTDIFNNIEPEFVDTLLNLHPKLHLEKDELLFQLNSKGDGMFILLEGKLSIDLNPNTSKESIVAEVNSGAVIGEIAFFTKSRRTAAVIAKTNCVLAFIDNEFINGRIADKDINALTLTYNLASIIAERMKQVTEMISRIKLEPSAKSPGEMSDFRKKLLKNILI